MHDPMQQNWKANLWEFFSMALGFFIRKGFEDKREKAGIVLVTVLVLFAVFW